MAQEASRVVSPWDQILAGASVASGALSGESGSINTAAGISAAEKLYELVEFELVVTGTPAADNNTVDLYRRPNGNVAGQVPTVAYKPHFVGSFQLKNAANGSYYVYGAVLYDEKDTYYLDNQDTGPLTLALNARTKSTKPAD